MTSANTWWENWFIHIRCLHEAKYVMFDNRISAATSTYGHISHWMKQIGLRLQKCN